MSSSRVCWKGLALAVQSAALGLRYVWLNLVVLLLRLSVMRNSVNTLMLHFGAANYEGSYNMF